MRREPAAWTRGVGHGSRLSELVLAAFVTFTTTLSRILGLILAALSAPFIIGGVRGAMA